MNQKKSVETLKKIWVDAKGQLILKGFLCFQFFQKNNKKFLRHLARAKVFKLVFWKKNVKLSLPVLRSFDQTEQRHTNDLDFSCKFLKVH